MAKQHKSDSLDMTNVNREVYIVKLPKYIAQRWQKAQSDVEVAKFCFSQCPGNQKPDISLILPDNLLKDGNETIAKKYTLDIKDISQSTSGILSKTVVKNADGTKSDKVKFSMLGKVAQKLECKPSVDNYYMKLKQEKLQKFADPVRQMIKLDQPVQKHEKISQYKINKENALRKREKIKNLRMEKSKVGELVCHAFKKHQYYKFQDLLKITKQPVAYLKEILKEYCNYNSQLPNKNTWELKPEYRHYK